MTTQDESCGACKFVHAYDHQGKRIERCARHAPTTNPVDGRSIHPLVPPQRWCGDFVRRAGAVDSRRKHASDCSCVDCLNSLPVGERWGRMSELMRARLLESEPDIAKALQSAAAAKSQPKK